MVKLHFFAQPQKVANVLCYTVRNSEFFSQYRKKFFVESDGSFREIKHNTVPWNLFFNKRSSAVFMSPDSEGLGAAVVAGVGSSLTQPSGISYFSLYTFFSEVFALVLILGRNSLLKFV